jgi:hypothetical protein
MRRAQPRRGQSESTALSGCPCTDQDLQTHNETTGRRGRLGRTSDRRAPSSSTKRPQTRPVSCTWPRLRGDTRLLRHPKQWHARRSLRSAPLAGRVDADAAPGPAWCDVARRATVWARQRRATRPTQVCRTCMMSVKALSSVYVSARVCVCVCVCVCVTCVRRLQKRPRQHDCSVPRS